MSAITPQRAQELLSVAVLLEALANGKTIQCRAKNALKWNDSKNPVFDTRWGDYRIKPEPRTWWCIIRNDGSVVKIEDDRKIAEHIARKWSDEPLNKETAPYTVVEVKEVL